MISGQVSVNYIITYLTIHVQSQAAIHYTENKNRFLLIMTVLYHVTRDKVYICQ